MTKRSADDAELASSPVPHKRPLNPCEGLEREIAGLEHKALCLRRNFDEIKKSEASERRRHFNLQQGMKYDNKAEFDKMCKDFELQQKSKFDAMANEMMRNAQQVIEEQQKQVLTSIIAKHQQDAKEAQQNNDRKLKILRHENKQIRKDLKTLNDESEDAVNTLSDQAKETEQKNR